MKRLRHSRAHLLLLMPAAAGLLLTSFSLARQAPPAAPPSTQTTIESASHINPPRENHAFPLGETYVYSAEWRLWTAGIATMTMTRKGQELQINGTADSAGFASVLYRVQDRFEAKVDARTFCSQNISKKTEEGFHRRDTSIHFDYAHRKSVLDERNLKTGESKHTERDIPGCVTDVISGIYYLSTQPLAPGSIYVFPMNDGGETADAQVRVEGREDVKVPAGTFHTVRATAQATSGKLKDKGKLWIWFTDDARHMPVQVRSRLFWGTLTFRLTQVRKP